MGERHDASSAHQPDRERPAECTPGRTTPRPRAGDHHAGAIDASDGTTSAKGTMPAQHTDRTENAWTNYTTAENAPQRASLDELHHGHELAITTPGPLMPATAPRARKARCQLSTPTGPRTARSVHPWTNYTTATSWRSPRRGHRCQRRHHERERHDASSAHRPDRERPAACIPGRTTPRPRAGDHHAGAIDASDGTTSAKGTMPAQHTDRTENGPQRASLDELHHGHELAITPGPS